MKDESVDTRPTGKYRAYLPDLTSGKFEALPHHDAHTWADEFYKNPFAKKLTETWLKLWEEPYKGLTSDGNLVPNLYEYEDQGVQSETIVTAAEQALTLCTPAESKALTYPVNARQWRSWSNPEIYISKYGLRLDEVSEQLSDAILGIIKATLSPAGYAKLVNAMRANHFLGQLTHGPKVLNQRSYNFILFGEPSADKAWGWNFWGHHVCMCVYLDRRWMMAAPVFIGAEPNEIDEGIWEGTTMMRPEEQLGLALMQSLPDSLKRTAQVYKDPRMEGCEPGRWNEADQRHLCGAFQDNRIVPYEGIRLTAMSESQISLVFSILREMLIYLPDTVWEKRKEQIQKHLQDTWFSWVGGYGDEDPFYYRIQSPVVVVEFDHHSGVFLNNKNPEKYHIHSIQRAPNAGDYGNALRPREARLT
ncbi:hypothetical protein P152DRAFT_435813 [Eremomyces bilateralis CBS 781.70]|uniref:DUF3500 domain-containing protein n=1 Tax=Eremomyces bilateralis CBS 781.70 TaxID=1392243 RepID=A0A6G1G3Q3_9PEZI|nr:uncharacterized protein P152DRAFT_435813 [Eremomyces bilateralis CBS 781.70]KAF1812561.1 hypothetical protein P152DRAFT_435813 [Eremomyces bilateralis CBS 781.70]